jgi:hypothetical protein
MASIGRVAGKAASSPQEPTATSRANDA